MYWEDVGGVGVSCVKMGRDFNEDLFDWIGIFKGDL